MIEPPVLGFPLLAGLLTAVALPVASGECRLAATQQRWIESAIAGWERVRTRALQLPDEPLPTLIFFDRYCTFTLPASGPAPRSLRVRVGDTSYAVHPAEHGGTIALPDGRSVPAQPATFASLMPGDTSTFLLIALEDVWRADPDSRQIRENWSEYLLRVLVHEMTHARQFPSWVPAARIAGGRVGLVDVDDDIVQQRFDTVPGFRQAVHGEIALLYEAATSTGQRQRELLRDALNLMRDRRERFFGGAHAPWAELEQLWLDLEGASQWAALAQIRNVRPNLGTRAALNIVRDSRTFWSQEEGLALYLALDALSPHWQRQVFAADPRSSLELLEEALDRKS